MVRNYDSNALLNCSYLYYPPASLNPNLNFNTLSNPSNPLTTLAFVPIFCIYGPQNLRVSELHICSETTEVEAYSAIVGNEESP